jgi:DNA polymerase-3 subunit alpha
MEYIPDYIAGKHGRKKPTYLHPKLKPILEKTYGVAVYQEQLMQIARELAGFTYGQADVLRKAVGKKIKELLDEQEIKMIDGMVAGGIERSVAKKIWEFILPFASYGFNRSHAACYAMIAYHTAYLKANYPAAFMAALLTSDQQNLDRIAIEVEECRQMGIEVLPPDVNESFADFGVVAESLKTGKPRIRFGLLAVKGLGENIVNEIIEERKRGGKYVDFEDLLSRVKSKDFNKRSMEAMARAGVLDSLAERNAILANMDKILAFIQEMNKDQNKNQNSLFDMSPQVSLSSRLKLEQVDVLEKKQKLVWEKEYLGLYVSEHPLSDIQARVRNYAIACSALKGVADGAEVRVAGVITAVKKIFTKKGDAMLFVKIEDTTGDTEILVFPRTLEQNPHLWQLDSIIICSGKVSDKDGESKVLCDMAAILNQDNLEQTMSSFVVAARERPAGGRFRKGAAPKAFVEQTVSLKLKHPLDYQVSKKLKQLIVENSGNHALEVIIDRTGKQEKIMTAFKINYGKSLHEQVEVLLGPGSIALVS